VIVSTGNGGDAGAQLPYPRVGRRGRAYDSHIPPSSSSSYTELTVAVTGPTGTFGFGLIPLLQSDPRIDRIVGIARRPFDPAEHGWAKMEYRQGDVRDQGALRNAFEGADVVVHLAFMITGTASAQTIRAINVEGTLNAFRAAAGAGATRFVYASSVAAYGFHPDNPVGMQLGWRPWYTGIEALRETLQTGS
jgi:nucleoside-diphosphate-sugar epimerase